MPKEKRNGGQFNAPRISPESAEKMRALLGALQSKENSDREASPPIAGGDGEERPPAREISKEKSGRKKSEAPKENREEEIGERFVALDELFDEFYGGQAKAGKLAPELSPEIKELEAELRKLGVKRGEIDELREKVMRRTGYWKSLPREHQPEPKAKAEGIIEVSLKSGEKMTIAPEDIPDFQNVLTELETRQELYRKSHQDQDDPKLAAEIGEVKNVLAEAAKAGWIKGEEEPLGSPAPGPGLSGESELEEWQREQARAIVEQAKAEEREREETERAERYAEGGRRYAGGLEKWQTERQAQAELERSQERLNKAREAFIQAEKNWEKYLGITGAMRGWFGGKAAVREEYERSREQYAEARAERVGADISIFLEEETKLADVRIQTAMERKKGLWEKTSKAWKWMGEVKLLPSAWRERLEGKGRLGRIVARGVNLRLAAGLGLMGMAVYAGPGSLVALGALGTRRAMAGVGATMFSSEWLNRRAEVSRTAVSDKELGEMNLEGAEARLGDMVVGLRMQGKLASESEDYGKLFSRYEALLSEEYRHLGSDAEYLKGASVATLEEFYHSMRKFKSGQDIRRAASIAAGVGAAVGVSSVLRYLYGAKEIAGAGAPAAGNLEPVTDAERIPAAISADDTVKLSEEEKRMVKEMLQEQAEVAVSGTQIPDFFEIAVQSGEGPIHEARKAISEYIALSGDEKLKGLAKVQRILAEEKLYRAVKDTLPEWKVGAKVSFPREAVERAVVEAAGQDPAKLAGIEPFTGRVNWPRYEVTPITYEESGVRTLYKPWEWDEGIQRVVKGAAKTAGVVEAPRYVPFDPLNEEEQLGKTFKQAPAEIEELKTKAEALKEAEPRLSEVLIEDSKEAKVIQDAGLDAGAEEIARIISRLDPEEYRAIKNLKVSEVLKKTFFGTTEETIWPSSRSPNHLDLWRKGKLRDSIAFVLEHLSPEKREEAAGFTIHQFIKEYYLKE